MKLRSGVTFHDGTPFNAAAVKFNIERAQSDKSAAKAQMVAITKVETISDTELKSTLNKPNAAILTLLVHRGGAIVSPAAVQKFGDNLGRNPVGTGKFCVQRVGPERPLPGDEEPQLLGHGRRRDTTPLS